MRGHPSRCKTRCAPTLSLVRITPLEPCPKPQLGEFDGWLTWLHGDDTKPKVSSGFERSSRAASASTDQVLPLRSEMKDSFGKNTRTPLLTLLGSLDRELRIAPSHALRQFLGRSFYFIFPWARRSAGRFARHPRMRSEILRLLTEKNAMETEVDLLRTQNEAWPRFVDLEPRKQWIYHSQMP